jgi:hypothetical protein
MKSPHVFVNVLFYLYKYPNEVFTLADLQGQFSKIDSTYFNDVIKWLEKDELIIEASKRSVDLTKNGGGESGIKSIKFSFEPGYRIYHKGFAFIKDLRNKRLILILNVIAIGAAYLGIFLNAFVFNPKQAVTKVEITNPIKIQSIKKDTINAKK